MNLLFACAVGWIRRALLVAERTWKVTVRQRVLYFFAVILGGLLISARWLAGIDFGGDPFVFVYEFGVSVLSLGGTLIALILPAQIWLGETEGGNCIPLLSGRGHRLDVFFGVYLGSVLVISGFLFPAFLLLFLLLLYWFPLHLENGLWTLLQCSMLLEWCRLCIIAAFGALIGSYSRSLFFSLMVGAAFVLSGELYGVVLSLSEDVAQGSVFLSLLLAFVPNLGLYSVGNTAFLLPSVTGESFALLIAYAVGYSALYLSLGGWIFRRRAW